MMFARKFSIDATDPFDFDLTASIFRNGDNQIRSYTDAIFRQVIELGDKLVLIELKSKGTKEHPRIEGELKSNRSLNSKDVEETQKTAKFIFNLDLNLNLFYQETKNDSVMSRLIKQLYGLKNPTTPTVFESLVDSIIEQQISIKVAISLEERLTKKYGDLLELEGNAFFAFPTPKNLSAINVDEIQATGLTRRKAEYIKGAAELIANDKLDLESLKMEDDFEGIIQKLDEIRGIGVWTAELTMLRGMQKLEALPADDLGIRRVISKYYCGGKPVNTVEARQIAQRWGRWKGLAAFYLIMAEIKEIAL